MRSAAPVRQNHLSKPEDLMLQNATPLRISARTVTSLMNMSLVIHLWRSPSNVPRLPSVLEMPQHLHGLLTFGRVENPLRLPREMTSERPKVVRTCGVFNMLTWKCSSRNNDAHFFNISTSKSAPRMVCFVDFDFEMCFAPQQRAPFRHRNFQKCSDVGVPCTF